jgi:hypothetical protein
MAKGHYEPPRQSALGQFFDSMFLLALVFAALFAPLYLGLAGGGKTAIEFTEKTFAGAGQNATMQAQWEKLGHTADPTTGQLPQATIDMMAARFDYSFNPIEVGITALVVIAYFFIVVAFSRSEYRDVIRERFDGR